MKKLLLLFFLYSSSYASFPLCSSYDGGAIKRVSGVDGIAVSSRLYSDADASCSVFLPALVNGLVFGDDFGGAVGYDYIYTSVVADGETRCYFEGAYANYDDVESCTDPDAPCPDGMEKDNFGDCVTTCPDGQYRDNTNECAPIPSCDMSYQDFNTTSGECEGTPPPADPEPDDCSTRWAGSSLIGTAEFCEDKIIVVADGSTLFCYRNCRSTPYTTETRCAELGGFIDYNKECVSDDTSPFDPDYNDGSSENDATNDIPDSTNDSTSSTTDTTNTNADGSSGGTSSSTTETTSRNYDEAFEAIGDNIEDSTKATNAQTSSNKQNTEFLGGKLDSINDNLSFDGSKVPSDFTFNEDDYQIDTDTFTSYMTTALEPITNYTTEKMDAVWDTFKDKFKDTVLFSETCQVFPSLKADFTVGGQTKEMVIFSQDFIDDYGIATIIKPIVIFIFTLMGLMSVFKEF